MTGHTPLDIKHFEKKIETESSIFRKQFEGKKFNITTNGDGNITSCETADKDIIQWLKDNGLVEV